MLPLKEKLNKDIREKSFTIYPVVVIGDLQIQSTSDFYTTTGKPRNLKISTHNETIKSYVYSENYDDAQDYANSTRYNLKYYDFDLKVGSVKESIDMDNRAYRISSVPISLSNYKKKYATYLKGENLSENGMTRLSDIIYSFYNEELRIYYKTQSCTSFQDMLLVYSGVVRNISHNDKTVNLVAEDRTDYLIHKDVPVANLGYGESVYSKDYLGKPIPITYGDVAQAPAVPYVYKEGASNYSTLSIISDDVSHVTGSERPISIYGYGTDESFPENTYFQSITVDADTDFDINPLYIYKGDYFRVLQNYNSTANTATNDLINFPEPRQYEIEETSQNLSIFKDFAASYPQNPPAANELQAIKVRYPNQCMLLKSANILNGDEGSDTTGVINLEVPQGILNPQAAIDNAFFGNGHFSSVREFDTFAEIPNSLRLLPEESTFQVHEFTPFSSTSNGWIHPTESDAGDLEAWGHGSNGYGGVLNKVNYLPLMYNWCHTYMHKLPALYIQLPPADLIKEHVDEFLKGNFGSNNSQEIGDSAIIYNTGSEPIYDNDRGSEFRPQYNISPHFCSAYVSRTDCNASSSVYGTNLSDGTTSEDYFEYSANQFDSVETGGNDYDKQMYYSTGSNTYANTGVARRNYRFNCKTDDVIGFWGQNWDSSMVSGKRYTDTAYKPLSGRISAQNGSQAYFPTNVYKFSQDYNSDNNPQQITNVYVGLWIDETMYSSMLDRSSSSSEMTPVGEKAIFINLWDLGDGMPYLYKSRDQFCTLNPNHLTYKEKVSHNIKCKFNSDWNGVKINHYMTNQIVDQEGNVIAPSVETLFPASYDADCVGGSYYSAPNWGIDNASCDTVLMREMVGNNSSDSNQNLFGGKSWFIYFEGEEPNGVKNLSDSAGEIGESKGEWNDSGANTRVPKHCLIPCNIKNYNGQYQGHNFNIDYIIDENRAEVNLSVGQGGTFEERLSILLPMGDLTAEDSFNVDTFVYGKVNLNIPFSDSTIPHNVDGEDNLKLICAATETVNISAVNFNAESPEELHGTELLNISGNDECFSNTSESTTFTWDVGNPNSSNNSFGGILQNRIESWDLADKFNSISLLYKLTGTNADHFCKISSEIYSIGVIQFLNFENALDSPFYADVKGRTSYNEITEGELTTWKYTDISTESEDALIEKPTDVLYSFIEQELNQINFVDRSSWKKVRNNPLDLKLAFSINELINSKEVFQGISKNTNIFPIFDSNGKFSFRSIRNEYATNDIDDTIIDEDVISYKVTKTPVSKIKTLINVKYRKDYETGEMTRETGWCDALDFYGDELYTDLQGVQQKGYSLNSYGLKRTDNIYIHENEYIRDFESALKFRDFLMMYYCNQYTIIDLVLPVSYIFLQVGDVVRFDKLLGGIKVGNEDYTKEEVRNGQIIYPYFMIESITKNINNNTVKVKLRQIHKLKPTFFCGKGSLSRRTMLGVSTLGGYQDAITEEDIQESYDIGETFNEETGQLQITGNLNFRDLELYEKYVSGNFTDLYFTTTMLVSGDINGNGSIDINDLNIINILLGLATIGGYADPNNDEGDTESLLGDVNQDGLVNVVDIVATVTYILGGDTSYDLEDMDLNDDGVVNVSDIVALVNIILNEE